MNFGKFLLGVSVFFLLLAVVINIYIKIHRENGVRKCEKRMEESYENTRKEILLNTKGLSTSEVQQELVDAEASFTDAKGLCQMYPE